MSRRVRMWRLWVVFTTAVIALVWVSRVYWEGFADAVTGAEAGKPCKKSEDCKALKCMIVDKDTKLLRPVKDSEEGTCPDDKGKIPGYTPPDDTKEAEKEEPTPAPGPDIGAKLDELSTDVGEIKIGVSDLAPKISDIQDKVGRAAMEQTDMVAKVEKMIRAHPLGPGGVEPKNLITAPGVARPVGSTSERPTYPAAASLEPTELESYVKTLVKSEMAEQGKPTSEGFQLQEIIKNVRGTQRPLM